MMYYSKWHWAFSFLWTLAALALVVAWVSVFKKAPVFNLEPLAWYWNALVLGVLANGCKGGCSSCGTRESDEKGGV